jgi:DNA-binding transcriptional LysR family regulator
MRVAPAIAAFVGRYPEMKFDLVVADRVVDLVDEGFDLAIRVGPVGSDRLVARRLGSMRLVPCAAPSYLARRGTPATPQELAQHDALTYAYSATPRVWRFTDTAGTLHELRVAGSLHANSGDALRSAAEAGLGVIQSQFLSTTRRVPVACAFPARLPGTPARSGRLCEPAPPVALVRLFVDHIAAMFAGNGCLTHCAVQQCSVL